MVYGLSSIHLVLAHPAPPLRHSVMSDSCNAMACSQPSSSFMGLSRWQYWSGVPFPPSGDLPLPGIEAASLKSPALASRFVTTKLPERPHVLSFSLVQWLSHVQLFVTPQTAACQASLGVPTPTPGLCLNLCLSWWCHATISSYWSSDSQQVEIFSYFKETHVSRKIVDCWWVGQFLFYQNLDKHRHFLNIRRIKGR